MNRVNFLLGYKFGMPLILNGVGESRVKTQSSYRPVQAGVYRTCVTSFDVEISDNTEQMVRIGGHNSWSQDE